MYNSVPKCGSTTVRQNFMTMARLNHYSWKAYSRYLHFNLSEKEEVMPCYLVRDH